jgi:Mor family transcriptional regulator
MANGTRISQLGKGPSRTAQALADIANGMPVPEACRKFELSESAVYLALRKKEARELGLCPCCLQPVKKEG